VSKACAISKLLRVASQRSPSRLGFRLGFQHIVPRQVPAPLPRGTARTQLALHLHSDGVPGMLGWALVFFILAIVAGYFGFFGLAGAAAGIAKILFLLFLALLVISFIVRAIRGQSVT
jgi:uncharacterized membrane protein YtjA (UPF0391 family)